MKKYPFFLLMVLATSILSCQHDDEHEAVTGSVAFGMSGFTPSGGRVRELATPAFALVSVSSVSGINVIEDKKLALTSFGNGYMSESLPIPPGDYQVLKFVILDSQNKALYATPMKGSSKIVNHPLPINFSVVKSATTELTPEVIEVEEGTSPQVFGYAAFSYAVQAKRTVDFELYSTAGYATDTHLIEFRPSIKDLATGKVLWDSTFVEMQIKDIPSAINRIKFSKAVYTNSQLRIGFDYYIKDCCYSWYVRLMDSNEPAKMLSFDFH